MAWIPTNCQINILNFFLNKNMNPENIKPRPEKPLIELEQKIEAEIKKRVMEFLEKGKSNWDVPHTLQVVDWMKQLLTHEGGNGRVLIPAAYFHDIGYSLTNVAGKKVTAWQKILDVKKEHAVLGAQKAEEILRELGGFSEEEIKEIVRLVLVHDNLWEMPNKEFTADGFNDFMVIEADSLSMIDPALPQNFSPADKRKFIEEEFVPQRLPLFRSEFGQAKVQELLQAANEQLERRFKEEE